MFALLPFIIWVFDKSVSSEVSFAKFKAAFNVGMLGLPGVIWKLVALLLIWAYTHHLFAGMRHVRMDLSHDAVSKEFGQKSAVIVFALSLGLTLLLALKLFGVY